MVKRFVEEVQIIPQNLSTGAASVQLSLADRLEAFKQPLARIGAEQGAAEAAGVAIETVDGQVIAPKKRKVGVKDFLLTGGAKTAAFNKTLRDGYFAALERDTREDLANFELKNPDDLTSYNSEVEGYKRGVLKGVDALARPAVEQFINEQVTNARIRIQGKSQAKAKAEAISSIEAAITSAGNQAASNARAGDQRGAASNLLDVFANVDSMVEDGNLDQARGAEIKREFERETTEQGFRFKLNATADLDGIDKAFEELDGMTNKVPKGWTPDEWDTFTRSARSDLSRIRAQEQATIQQADIEAKQKLNEYQNAVAMGFDVDPAEKQEMQNMIAGNEELEEKFAIIEDVAAFAVSSLNDRNALLNSMQTGELEDVALFSAATVANNEINKLAIQDGYSLGVNQGLIQKIPFDIADAQSFAARVEQSQLLSNHYGVEVSPLSSGEAQALTNGLADMTTPEKIALANTLSQAPAIWGQIASKQGGTFAMAGATGDANVMTNVFEGQALIDAKLAVAPKPSDYLQDFTDFTEGIYGPEDARNLLNSSIAYYVNVGDRTGSYDASDLEDAIEAVSGGIGKINGFRLELPRGVSEDDFEDLIDDMQPGTVAELGGVAGLSNEEAAKIIQQSRIRSVKTNQYIVETNMGTLFKADGTPFIIEYTPELAGLNQSRGPKSVREIRTGVR